MANIIQVKRRVSGLAGAPASLKSGEIAHNEIDQTLYVGLGDDGTGTASSITPLAGKGAFVDLASTQTIPAVKIFSQAPRASVDASLGTELVRKSQLDAALSSLAAGDMLSSVYDTDADGKVDQAEAADSAPWTGITGKPSTFPPATHSHAISEVTGLQTSLDAKAPLASPSLTGTPTAPTATPGLNNTQIATTAFVQAAVNALIGSAPGTLDTLNELAAALGDDPNFASSVTSGLAEKLVKSANLSDLTDAAQARSNLGLGSLALQSAGNVNITGGSLSGVTIDCGTF